MKNIFKFLSKEILIGGHILSIGGVCVSFAFMYILGLEIDYVIAFSIYFFGQPIFFIDRYVDLRNDGISNKNRTDHTKRYYKFIPLIVVLYLLIFIAGMIISGKYFLLLLGFFLFVIGSLYGSVFKPLTKYIPMFKNIFVSLFWALFGFYTVFGYENAMIGESFILFFFYVFFRTLAIQTFFDIRDIEGDRLVKLKTAPLLFGKRNTLIMLSLINLITSLLLVCGLTYGMFESNILFLIFPVILFQYIIFKSFNTFKLKYILFSQLEYLFWGLFLIIVV